MRIGVVSDTHLPRFQLPDALLTGLAGVDLILHLGDFTGEHVPALFEAIAPLEAVAGNNDGPGLVRRYGYQKVIEADGLRIGLVHGHGSTHPAKWVARRTFEDVDFVCYGHSHIPECVQEAGVWYLNPGSPTDKRRMPDYTYAIIQDGIPVVHHFPRGS